MSIRRTILIIDDDADSREVVREALEGKQFDFLEAKTGEEAIELFTAHDIDVVTCDIMLPGADGIEVLRHIKEVKSDAQVIMLTGLNAVDTAVEAMRLGALDYLTKPIRLKELRVVIDRAIQQKELTEERDEWRRQVARYSGRLLGKSPAMKRIFHIIEQAAPTRSTVLLTGETGTGKDQVAQEIHEQSRRSNKPLIKVDCASLPESLLESELFGHVRGAFTGAFKDRKGRFELADGGTLFLNEIGEMSAGAQQRLLRILQDGELERVGSNTTIHVDVRVLAATNKDLQQCIAENKFREDLYYRLRVVQIHLAPLRERREDIPILAQSFLERYSEETGKELQQFDHDVIEFFLSYPWPGNVRELQHAVEHAAIFAQGRAVTLHNLPEEITRMPVSSVSRAQDSAQIIEKYENSIVIPIGSTLEDAELEIIRLTLEKVGGNKEEAARVLGLSRSSLYRRLPKLAQNDES
ncbi:MAG: sigma-54-dependent Fis family transcriptional regulator [Candidatus Omnitrophota bacterium]|nr:MAG: sigma-54-dependent Fis family transcriptional regulator [Candidatus Omnitrophota bacterium]